MAGDAPITLPSDDPTAARLVLAIRTGDTGDTSATSRLLAADPAWRRYRSPNEAVPS